MKSFYREEIKNKLNSNLIIYWWNFGTKRLDFKGSANEYLKREKIKLTKKYYFDNDLEIEQVKLTVSFNCGNLAIKFTSRSIEDAIRMSINIRLSYLGDKSKFTFLGRERSINF